MTPNVTRSLLGTILALLLVGLIPSREPRAQVYVDTGDTLHPRIRYADSLLSLNDRCIVKMTKLGKKTRPVYVNGHPVGFC